MTGTIGQSFLLRNKNGARKLPTCHGERVLPCINSGSPLLNNFFINRADCSRNCQDGIASRGRFTAERPDTTRFGARIEDGVYEFPVRFNFSSQLIDVISLLQGYVI